MMKEYNWAGNYKYSAAEICFPESLEQAQEIVARNARVKVLGTRHSFNHIADTDGVHVSLQRMNRIIELDRANHKVTIEAGIRYGELCRFLHDNGYALPNLASLPHISVAGACATATHGSGDRNGNLATSVHSLEIVKADGETARFSRDDQGGTIAGAIVHLGALGVVARLTLNVIPTFQMSQVVYENLPLATLGEYFDEIYGGGYSVSLFTDWKGSMFNQVWVKRLGQSSTDSAFYGAQRADSPRHPVPGFPTENCSEQLGRMGPWHERLPHFRMEFVPSAGDELQSEYFVGRQDAYKALCALDQIKDQLSPYLYISEVRSIAADDLWMSPCYGRDSIAIHFTWRSDWGAVQQLLPLIEEQLAPYGARPHWGKLFAMSSDRLQSLYEKLPDFRELVARCDPHGKFSNEFINKYIKV